MWSHRRIVHLRQEMPKCLHYPLLRLGPVVYGDGPAVSCHRCKSQYDQFFPKADIVSRLLAHGRANRGHESFCTASYSLNGKTVQFGSGQHQWSMNNLAPLLCTGSDDTWAYDAEYMATWPATAWPFVLGELTEMAADL